MIHSITTEPATPEDFDSLVELRIEAMRESLEAIGRFDRQRSIERFRASFFPERIKIIKIPAASSGLFKSVDAIGDRVPRPTVAATARSSSQERRGVGPIPNKGNWILLGFIATTEKQDHIPLDHLYIHPKFQSQGIGTQLMYELIEYADQKILPIRLGALRASSSNGFYQRNGFVVTNEDEFDVYYERSARANRAANSVNQD